MTVGDCVVVVVVELTVDIPVYSTDTRLRGGSKGWRGVATATPNEAIATPLATPSKVYITYIYFGLE